MSDLQRSEKLQRINSFNKIVNTYNNICAQNILFLPNLLIWLRSSILQQYIDKLIKNLKLYTYTNVTTYVTKKHVSTTTTVPSVKRKDELTRQLSKRELFERQLSTVREIPHNNDSSGRVWLKALVYLCLVFVYTQMCALVYVLSVSHVTWGMAFLLVAALHIIVLGMVLIRPTVKRSSVQRKRCPTTNNRKFDLSKAISKVKIL